MRVAQGQTKDTVMCLELQTNAGEPGPWIRPQVDEYQEWLAFLRAVAMKGAALEKLR